eukprot:TRINITY_DN43594_c0_g1_i2.p1 TRINITY_DN43594_c0_g1~~TRINITY_DN43594_c0_g1_i2.p1  ORF type:complete len:282 (-),score=50.20 TRINITY_DN43594_c0_g1_i2:184-1029(-)
MDVLGVDWSPDGCRLASCSIDNTVRIWSGESWTSEIVLAKHSSMVKGVAWDLLGKFLVSQADDSAIIWRASDWGVEATIRDVFDPSTEAFFRRCGWSPDGSWLTLTAAFKNGEHRAVAYERGSWKPESTSRGHGNTVLACAWNPCILQTRKEKETNTKHMLWALGCGEPKVSVWSTSKEPALVLISEMFGPNKEILDLCWCPDGLHLLACSKDGTVGCIRFSTDELGSPISNQEYQMHIRQLHGAVLGAATVAAQIPECPADLAPPPKDCLLYTSPSPRDS